MPTGVTATAGDGSANVSWTAPSSTGGSTITSYVVTPFDGTTALGATTVTGNPAATTATVNGLTNGTAYTFTVTAANVVGSGTASDRLPRGHTGDACPARPPGCPRPPATPAPQ